jgi:TrmH family RNA methyltransferase
MITSLQNEKVKLARALQSHAKARRAERKMVLEGVRLVRDVLERGQRPDFVFYTAELEGNDLITHLERQSVSLLPVSAEVMRHVSDTQQPQGILAVFALPLPALPQPPRRVLILDAVREPGNMGTMLRTAAAAGAQIVLLAPGCVDPYNPKALRGGMGAHFRLPVVEAQWDQITHYCDGLAVYLADSQGDTAYTEVNWSQAWALIIGGEAHGAGSHAAQLAHKHVYIPMAAETESLNAAIAAAVILFEANRR